MEFGRSTGGVVAFYTGMGDNKFRFNTTDFLPSFQDINGIRFDKFVPRVTFSGPLVPNRAWFFDGLEAEFDDIYIRELPQNAATNHLLRGSNLVRFQANATPGNIVSCLLYTSSILIDQSPVGVSSRSNPGTYTGIMDEVRKAFAAANNVSPSLFSFNSEGACENCQGLGVIYTEIPAMGEVKSPCEICEGKRFKDEVLEYKLNGKSINDVLGMTVRQALEYFKIDKIASKLQAMSDVGLDYLTLGQPLSTLSGGECQRIKLASELHKQGSIYVLDEPTTGLHMSDISHLLEIVNRLVDAGNTVIVIEHNTSVIKNADWIIDMGPEGGTKGGKVIFEGTPRQLLTAKKSLTSEYIRN